MSDIARADYSYGQVSSDTELLRFLVQSALSRTSHATPVQIMSVTNSGGISPIGYVSIRPLVQQVTGDGVIIDHGDIANVPYLRIQGGANAVIIDPEVGDIGIALFCDRDISVVKSTKSAGAPGSNRTNHMADAIYLQSIIGAAPSQYVQFADGGISVVSPTKVTVHAPNIQIDGNTAINGNVTIAGAQLTHNGVNVGSTHTHTGVQTGSGSTGLPQ